MNNPSLKILLAEDCPDTRRLFTYMLKKLGMQVEVVENGMECVALALTAQKVHDPFDLILIDLDMPVLDGCSAVKTLRKKGYKLPIVAITAEPSLGEMQASMHSGCDAFLAKINIEQTLPVILKPLLANK
jgi:CheY-like chemotaxis protein